MVTFDQDSFFAVFPWNPQRGWGGTEQHEQGLESIAACNFTIGGFIQTEDLPACEATGMSALYYDPVFCHRAQPAWNSLSQAEIDEVIRGWMANGGDSPSVYGFYIYDEPGATAFPGLARAVDAVRRLAPNKLAYINLFPNYATMGGEDSQLQTETYEEHLERFVQEVRPQVLSWDNYMPQYSDDGRDVAQMTLYYTNLVQMRAVAQRHGLPYWQTVSPSRIFPRSAVPTPANLAFQAWTSLAAGCSSVAWYCYYDHGMRFSPVDDQERRNLTWYWLAEVNRQLALVGPLLKAMRSTGLYFITTNLTEPVPAPPEPLASAVSAEQPLMLGTFKDADGACCCVVVNLDLDRTAKVTLAFPRPVQELSLTGAGWMERDENEPLCLAPGQGGVLRVAESC